MLRATLIAGVVVCAAVVSGCQSTPAPTQVPVVRVQVPANTVLVVPPSSHVTGTYPGHCTARGPLPDRVCTPGSIRGDMVSPTPRELAVTICHPGWTATVRPPSAETERLKTVAMTAYGVPVSERGVVELDHDIPIELGGSNDVTNLWPEVSDEPGHGFRNSKDKVENTLRAAVCANRVQLGAAQLAIAADWTTAEQKLGLGT